MFRSQKLIDQSRFSDSSVSQYANPEGVVLSVHIRIIVIHFDVSGIVNRMVRGIIRRLVTLQRGIGTTLEVEITISWRLCFWRNISTRNLTVIPERKGCEAQCGESVYVSAKFMLEAVNLDFG